MKEKDPIDKLFSKKLNTIQYGMHPGDWQAAVELIEQEKRRKKRIMAWIFGFSSVLIVLGLLWFLPGKTSQRKNFELSGSDKTASFATAQDGGNHSMSVVTPKETVQLSEEQQNSLEPQSSQLPNPKHSDFGTHVENKPTLKSENSTSIRVKPETKGAKKNSDLESGQGDAYDGEFVVAIANQENSPPGNNVPTLLPGLNWRVDRAQTTGFPSLSPFSAAEMTDEAFEPVIGLGLAIGSLFNIGSEQFWEGPQAGVLATYQFQPKWGLQLGVMYAQNHSMARYSQLEFQSEYDFGSVTKTLGMHGEVRHFLGIPLLLKYQLDRWSVLLGAEPSYTLGIQGSIHEVILMPTQGKRSNKVQDVVQSISEGWLPTGPYEKWNIRAVAGVRYRVNKGLFLQGTLMYQFLDDLKEGPEALDQAAPSPVSIGLAVQIMLEQ